MLSCLRSVHADEVKQTTSRFLEAKAQVVARVSGWDADGRKGFPAGHHIEMVKVCRQFAMVQYGVAESPFLVVIEHGGRLPLIWMGQGDTDPQIRRDVRRRPLHSPTRAFDRRDLQHSSGSGRTAFGYQRSILPLIIMPVITPFCCALRTISRPSEETFERHRNRTFSGVESETIA